MRPPLLAIVALSILAPVRSLPAQEGEAPNVILCMADDQGWGDVAYNEHPTLQTPTLDEMAAEGLRFDRFYAAAPVCSPTRGSVLTGRHPNRFGCFSWGYTIQPSERTLAEAMQSAGYQTGHFGKWHLGSVRAGAPTSPGENGFDEWVSSPNFYENSPLMSHRGRVIRTEGESSRVTVDAALRFIRRAADADEPFLAVIWFGNPHTPHVALPGVREPYAKEPQKRQNYYGEITGIDRAMGHLREELRALGIADRTLVWYTSDNGSRPPGSTGGLRGIKGQLWEGGIRVPGIIEWPAKIRAPRRTSVPAGTVDILPTILELCGIERSDGPELDGVSLAQLIQGESFDRAAPLGFWVHPARGRPAKSNEILRAMRDGAEDDESKPGERPAPSVPTIDGRLPGRAAWIDGTFKLHRIPAEDGTVGFELYDLSTDPAEARDLAADDTERVERMAAALRRWQKSVVRSCKTVGAERR